MWFNVQHNQISMRSHTTVSVTLVARASSARQIYFIYFFRSNATAMFRKLQCNFEQVFNKNRKCIEKKIVSAHSVCSLHLKESDEFQAYKQLVLFSYDFGFTFRWGNEKCFFFCHKKEFEHVFILESHGKLKKRYSKYVQWKIHFAVSWTNCVKFIRFF